MHCPVFTCFHAGSFFDAERMLEIENQVWLKACGISSPWNLEKLTRKVWNGKGPEIYPENWFSCLVFHGPSSHVKHIQCLLPDSSQRWEQCRIWMDPGSPHRPSSPNLGLEKVVQSGISYWKLQTSSVKWNDLPCLEWWLSHSWCLKNDSQVGMLLKRQLTSSFSDFVRLKLTWHCKSTILQ